MKIVSSGLRACAVAGLLLLVGALVARADSLVRAPWTNHPVEVPGSANLPAGEYVLTYVAGAVSHDPRRGYEVTEAYVSSGVRAGYHVLDSLEPESISLDLWLASEGLQAGATVAEVE